MDTYQISVTATDQNGIFNTKSFALKVVIPGVPVFLNSISSQTVSAGNKFSIAIPLDAAVNPNNPNAAITYSARLAGNQALPSWMYFDGTELSGIPPQSAIILGDATFTIVLTATSKEGQASASTVFSVIVTGTSGLRQALSYGIPLLTITTALLAARVRLFNSCAGKPSFISCVNVMKKIFCCCFDEKITYYESEIEFSEGESLEYTFKTPRGKIDHYKTVYCTHQYRTSLSPWYTHPETYPNWLKLQQVGRNFKLIAECVPSLEGTYAFEIYAVSKGGYNLEKVTLNKKTKLTSASEDSPAKRAGKPTSSLIELTENKEGECVLQVPSTVGDRTGYGVLTI